MSASPPHFSLVSSRPMNVVSYRLLPESLCERIARHHNLICVDPFRDAKEFERVLPLADALIGAAWKLDRRQLDLATRLKVVSSISAGVDHVDTQVLKERDIMLCSSRGKVEACVADLALALMLAISRRLPEMQTLVRDGNWRQPVGPELFGMDVHGKTLGIIGFGGIGQAIAQRAALGFDMQVLYHRRTQQAQGPSSRIQPAPMSVLLKSADLVVCTLPISPDTYHLMNTQAFEQMKTGSIFINVGRGGTVDEQALLQALDSGKLLGAGLDVYATEPLPQESRLRTHPRVLALPHIGGATQETRFAMLNYAVDNLLNALAGQPPTGIVALSGLTHHPCEQATKRNV